MSCAPTGASVPGAGVSSPKLRGGRVFPFRWRSFLTKTYRSDILCTTDGEVRLELTRSPLVHVLYFSEFWNRNDSRGGFFFLEGAFCFNHVTSAPQWRKGDANTRRRGTRLSIIHRYYDAVATVITVISTGCCFRLSSTVVVRSRNIYHDRPIRFALFGNRPKIACL